MAGEKKDNKASPHAGHRDRLRDRFMIGGFNEGTADHEILEFILMHTIPRRDTNKLAHDVVNKFGSFNAVMDASIEDLMKIGKLTKNSAVLIKSILPIAREYSNRKLKDKVEFHKISDIAPYLCDAYNGYTCEVVSLLLINEAGYAIKLIELSKGDTNTASISIKNIVDCALRYNASTVVLVHNHPGGVALPSTNDITVTKEVRLALSHIGIRLIDHVIIADGDYISLATSKKFSTIF